MKIEIGLSRERRMGIYDIEYCHHDLGFKGLGISGVLSSLLQGQKYALFEPAKDMVRQYCRQVFGEIDISVEESKASRSMDN